MRKQLAPGFVLSHLHTGLGGGRLKGSVAHTASGTLPAACLLYIAKV